jgi:molybdenum cofactor synthesis domain-containing protein
VAGVLASVNVRTLAVVPRARVAVMSTGDELVDDGAPLGPGQIRESNKTMLLGMITAAGAEAVDYGVVRDDEAVLEATLRRAAAECDAIVTSGGVSMGDYDVVKAVLGRIAEMRWMQIAIKPAKPFAFGVLAAADGRGVPVFGLPGNPVSSMVSFELFARPGLRQMMGHADNGQVRLWPTRPSAASPTARPTTPVCTARSGPTVATTSDPWVARAVTSWWPRRQPRHWPWCPTATASPPVARST